MKALIIACSILLACFPVAAKEFQLGNDVNKLIRMQTVDPLAENKVPTGSPPFSGKKAAKSINTESKGNKAEEVKSKNLLDSML